MPIVFQFQFAGSDRNLHPADKDSYCCESQRHPEEAERLSLSLVDHSFPAIESNPFEATMSFPWEVVCSQQDIALQ